ncbi:MAG TPA: membrane protein insertase YidC, partial [Piscirickettsiaceae bacterium]|nr:membrane protein insertase YidC [Piscirickettsiaceae bacterium]
MNIRALWWIALAFTLMWIWLEWIKFTAPKPPQAETSQQNLPAVEAVQQASQLAQEGAADTP